MTQIEALLAFLFPLGIYSLILAAINRRSRPVFVSGSWDAIGLLFASSGFFLGTVPLLFDAFYFPHWLIWLVYYFLLLVGGASLVFWRHGKTMIYNVDPDLFAQRLQSTLTLMGLQIEGRGRRLVIVPTPPASSSETGITDAPLLAAARDLRHVDLEVETFPSLCHVTLHWGQGTPGMREAIEKELRSALVGAVPEDNPVAGWMLSAAGLIFGMVAMIVGAFGVLLLRWGRWI